MKMSLKTLLVIKSLVCLCFGVLLLASPVFTYSIFGADVNDGGVFAGREYGAALIGTMLLTWYARNAVDSRARRAIILDLFIYDGIGAVVTFIAQLNGLFNPLGWSIVALYLFLAIAFGYFWFTKPVQVAQTAEA
jgi:preprotein translocase subunit SecY